MNEMFALSKRYTYSFKSWELNPKCKFYSFLHGNYIWQLFNTDNDLPMQNGKRIEIFSHKKIWKVL